jgi:hypothetical protein
MRADCDAVIALPGAIDLHISDLHSVWSAFTGETSCCCHALLPCDFAYPPGTRRAIISDKVGAWNGGLRDFCSHGRSRTDIPRTSDPTA